MPFLRYSFTLAGYLISLCLSAQTLTPAAQISLITETPGAELYLAFGHSQIRIVDPVLGIDQVYNYGVFDLEQPGFYTKFMRGRLEYMLAAYPTQYALRNSASQGRGLIEQVLNLSPAEKNRLFAFLEHNVLPENRGYLYDYFYDNCSSHIRDIFDKVLGDSLKWDYSASSNPAKPKNERTIRDYMNEFLEQAHDEYGRMGLDILLGLPTDKVISPKEEMYLPYYLMYHFDKARILTPAGWQPLVKQKNTLLLHTLPFEKPALQPVVLFWSLFGLTLLFTAWQWRSGNFNRALDVVLFLLTGLLGILIFLLWFFTDHHAASGNLNIIWAMPLNFVAAFVLLSRKQTKTVRWYFAGYAGLLGLLLLSWSFLPQGLNPNLIPFVLLLAVRSVFLFYRSAQK